MTRMIIVVEVPETLQEDAVRGLFEFVKCEVVSIDRAAELPLEPSAQQNGADEVCAKCGCAEPFHYSGCEDAAKAPF